MEKLLHHKDLSNFIAKGRVPPAKTHEALLNSVVRIFCTHSEPNFAMPWQRLKQESSTSSGLLIDGNRILTNAHSVDYGSLIQVKKRESEKKYIASVIAGMCVCSPKSSIFLFLG